MIRSYANRGTADIALGVNSKVARSVLPPSLHEQALEDLSVLAAAKSLKDLGLSGYNLELLRGRRAGQHSIRINRQYRICFTWTSDGVEDVEIVDYHDERR